MIQRYFNVTSISSYFSKIMNSPYFFPVVCVAAVVLSVWFLLPKVAIGDSVPFESTSARLVVIAILAVIAIIYLINIRILVSKKNNQANSDDPTVIRKRLAKERKEFKKNVDKAFSSLKNVFTHGQNRKHYLYKMPWYLLIGLPSSGKTTAVINSGLKLSLRQQLNRDLQAEIAHLGQYEWWLTDDAVILDAAKYKGETPIEGEAGSEWNSPMQNASWMAVLKLLKNLRDERPLSGVVVTVSLPDLIANKEEEARAYIHFIRQRIQTIHEELEICVPIYLILTKCDCIAGFSEFFANLNQEQRSQIWGMTVPFNQSTDIRKVSDFFNHSFDGLVKRLQEKLIVRLSEEQDKHKREKIALFPNQVQLCKQPIADLIVETFSATHYYEDESLQLRGIYMTSAMQAGNPHDLLMNRVADRYHLQQSKLPTQPSQGRSYFIKNIFQKVIFPEAKLVGYSQRAQRRQTRKRKVALVSAAGVLTAVTMSSSMAYYENKSNLVEIKDNLKQYHKVAEQLQFDFNQEASILPLLTPLHNIIQLYQDSSLRWFKRLTLYYPYKITQASEQALNRTINYYLLPQIVERLEKELQQNLDNSRDVYDLLTAYLVFSNNPYIDKQSVIKPIEKIWSKNYENNFNLQNNLHHYLQFALLTGVDPQPLNQSLIHRAKNQIADQVPTEQAYQLLIQHLDKTNEYQFSMTEQFAPLLQRFIVPDKMIKTIPGLFTADGALKTYPKQVKKAAQDISELNWKLDISPQSPTDAEVNQIIDLMRVHYVNDYHKHWQEALKSMEVIPFRNLNHGVNVLTFLTSNQNPLQNLLNTLEKQIYFTGKNKDITVTFEELQRFIKEKKLPEVLQVLTQLRDYLSDINNTPDTNNAQFQAAWDYMKGEATHPISQVKLMAKTLPEPLQAWLNAIASHSLNVLLNGASEVIARAWENDVLPEFDQYLKNRYPLKSASESQVDLARFDQFFNPDGTLMRFYDQYVSAFMDSSSNRLKVHPEAQQGLKMNSQFIRSLQQTLAISRIYFPNNNKKAKLQFGLSPRTLDSQFSRVRLKLGSKEMTYQHGPQQRQQFSWPVNNDIELAEMVVTDFNGRTYTERFEGPWSFFKLLEKAELRTVKPGQYAFTLTIGGRSVSFNVYSTQDLSAFQLSQLKAIQLPNKIS